MADLDYLKDDKSNISRYAGTPMVKSIPKTLGRKCHLPTRRQPESNVVIPGTKKEK
jgi:hypothetical protein